MNIIRDETFYTPLFDRLFYTLLPHRIGAALSHGLAVELWNNLPEPWAEHREMVKAYERNGGRCGVGEFPSREPLAHLLDRTLTADKNTQGECVDISENSADSLLDRLRGKWRRPAAWQREDFEDIFQRPLGVVLREIKAHRYGTFSALAKLHGRKSSWVSVSLRWCLVREKLITHDEAQKKFNAWFPKSPTRKKGTR